MANSSKANLATLFSELGIPDNYGESPALANYAEATELVDAGLNIVGRMQRLTPATESSWSTMQVAAHEDGCELLMVSGFRSIEYQAGLIRNKIASGQIIEDILQVNVAPGFSQHHTGKAIDIATPGFKPLLEEFEKSSAFEWLHQNAAKFGFRMSYPRGNLEGINYEPWHWCRSEQ
jgi:D-alanyl-D-alanine carboxypeptidase